jgi:PIN domain nuclease of toxin-antitoxin system
VLWWNSESSKITKSSKRLIEDSAVEKLVSDASIWEMAIKIRIGKLHVQPDLKTFVQRNIIDNGMRLLPIHRDALYETQRLELHHQDPFDRLIIAHAIVENISVISSDSTWKLYPIEVIG